MRRRLASSDASAASTTLLDGLEIAVQRSFAPPHVVDVHLDGARPGGPSAARPRSETRLRIVDATSARFSPYSTTTWRSIVTPPSASPRDLDALRRPLAAEQLADRPAGAMPTTP